MASVWPGDPSPSFCLLPFGWLRHLCQEYLCVLGHMGLCSRVSLCLKNLEMNWGRRDVGCGSEQ